MPYTSRVLAENIVRRGSGIIEDRLSQIAERKRERTFRGSRRAWSAMTSSARPRWWTSLACATPSPAWAATRQGEPGGAGAADRRPLAGGGMRRRRSDAFAKNRDRGPPQRGPFPLHRVDPACVPERRRDPRPATASCTRSTWEDVAGDPCETASRTRTPASAPDSHTPHVDALGVIAIGVGGLRPRTSCWGAPRRMRLPEMVGVDSLASASRHHGHRHRAGADRNSCASRRWSAPIPSSAAPGKRR